MNTGRSVTKAFSNKNADPLKLHRLFFEMGSFKTFDLKDRLYGLLGLVSDGTDKTLYVDYTEPLADLSPRLSRYLLQYGSVASLLNHAVGLARVDEPPWTVAFEEAPDKVLWYSLITVNGECRDDLFYTDGRQRLQARLISGTDTLYIKGSVIGTLLSKSNVTMEWVGDMDSLTSIGEFKQLFCDDSDRITSLLQWIQDAHAFRLASHGSSDVRGELFELSCWRTMTADIVTVNDGTLCRIDTLPKKDDFICDLAQYAAIPPHPDTAQLRSLAVFLAKMFFLYTRCIALTETGLCNVPREP